MAAPKPTTTRVIREGIVGPAGPAGPTGPAGPGASPNAWVNIMSFLNGWSNLGGAGFDAVSTRLSADGTRVELRGQLGVGSLGAPAFALPAGQIPTADKQLLCMVQLFKSNSQIGQIDIGSLGNVIPNTDAIGALSFTLNGITFSIP